MHFHQHRTSITAVFPTTFLSDNTLANSKQKGQIENYFCLQLTVQASKISPQFLRLTIKRSFPNGIEITNRQTRTGQASSQTGRIYYSLLRGQKNVSLSNEHTYSAYFIIDTWNLQKHGIVTLVKGNDEACFWAMLDMLCWMSGESHLETVHLLFLGCVPRIALSAFIPRGKIRNF